MSRLTLPSAHHQLAVDPKLASLNQDTATLTATNIGSGQVELVDQNVDAGEVVKTPTAQLHVVPPSRIQINCIPAKSWTVLVGGSYTLQAGLAAEIPTQKKHLKNTFFWFQRKS